MIVVSGTSPITALLAAGQADLLTKLFGKVFIPPAVHSELLRTHPVLPDWVRVQTLRDEAQARLNSQTSTAAKQKPLPWRKNSGPTTF